MKKYFTKNNLIWIAVSAFYAITVVFTGLCIEGGHRLFNSKNPIAALAKSMNLQSVTPSATGFVLLTLVAFYVIILITAIIYETNFAKINRKKIMSLKTWLIYLATFVICLALSFGLGTLIQINSPDMIPVSYTFLGESFGLGSLIFICLFIVIGSIVLFIYALKEKTIEDRTPKKETDKDDNNSMEDMLSDGLSLEDSFDDVNQNTTANANGEVSANGAVAAAPAEELDDREKVFPGLSILDEKYCGTEVSETPSDPLSLSQIATSFRNYLAKSEHLYFDEKLIRYYLAGMFSSQFMILEGLSGTGKSSLPRYFAKFTSSDCLFVPVQSTWRDKSAIFGYFNDFSKTYTETDFLLGLYRANYEKDRLFIFVLDEMNISRVEYYFADLLSVMEYPEDERMVKLMQLPYGFVPPALLDNGVVRIPHNCIFVGTANKDDSTFMISDKVYDRATVIDFSDRHEAFEVKEDVAPIHLSRSYLDSLVTECEDKEENKMNKKDYEKLFQITGYIEEKFDVCFGNRVLNQIDNIVPVYVGLGGSKEEALDYILANKVLSKIEGRFEDYIKPALSGLKELIISNYGSSSMNESLAEIDRLMRRL